MASADDFKLGPVAVAALYVEHGDELRRFLTGLLRDGHLAADVLQTTFTKAVETGHTARPESLKSWLFTVAYHEAMLVRCREATDERALSERFRQHVLGDPPVAPESRLVHTETVERVWKAL